MAVKIGKNNERTLAFAQNNKFEFQSKYNMELHFNFWND